MYLNRTIAIIIIAAYVFIGGAFLAKRAFADMTRVSEPTAYEQVKKP